jgi:NhaP-type Na+/H+ or K+/H+ antiporter
VAVIRELESLLSNAGGLVVVAIGVIAVMTITSASLGTVAEQERATVATAAFTVLGTIVGAYFGVRVGARGKDEAEAARAVAAAKVERLAAHVDAQQVEQVLDSVNQAAHKGTLPR